MLLPLPSTAWQERDPFRDLSSPSAVVRASEQSHPTTFLSANGEVYTLSFGEDRSDSGWELKFKVEDLTKAVPDGRMDFDRNVNNVLAQMSQLHQFFKIGLEAVNRNGYHFKLYDPNDAQLGDAVKAEMANGASACTSVVNRRVYLVLKTGSFASASPSPKELVATLAYELVHVIKNRTYSRYEDELEAFKNIKSIVDQEKTGNKKLTNAEELLFQVAEQELLGRSVSENVSALCLDDHSRVDRGYFSGPAFRNRQANYVMHVFENMWGRAALDALKNNKSPHPEIVTDAELQTFLTRLSRNILESTSGEKIASDLKAWGFVFEDSA